jgi:membrane protease YdiL (CAAX protease family)
MNNVASKKWLATFAVIGYVGVVLLVDVGASLGVRSPFNWAFFRWHLGHGFDLFKFVAWFVIPLLFSLPRMDWGYLGVTRWRRVDLYVLGGLALACALAVAAIPFFPSLTSTYQGVGHISSAQKWSFAVNNVVWIFSWLLGWEFLHRYVLLRRLSAHWPRFGWLAIPVFEGAYHLIKPLPEMLGMVAFSLILTPWALKRRNVLLPFLAHLIIELELVAFLLVT